MLSGYFRRIYRSATQGGASAEKRAEEKRVPDIDTNLEGAIADLQKILGEDSDLIIRRFRFGAGSERAGALLFFDGMTNSDLITQGVLRPMRDWAGTCAPEALSRVLTANVLCASDIKSAETPAALAAACLTGDAVLLLDGCAEALVVSAKGYEKRAVTEPETESVVRGPREGFTESLRTNTALIRRKIKTGDLRSEVIIVGKRTQTSVCLMYLDGVADQKVLETARFRIKNLDVDSILESGALEQFICDAPFSPFGTIGYSEKPDVVAGRMLEGRVAIVVDGTPFVLTVPMLFIESFQTAEDYYARTFYASMVRILRYVAYFVAITGPAIFVALTAFHQELIPTTLLLTIANAREGTPFPVSIEALIMLFAFEILREGGIRLPQPVGQAISIVGALVMGDAAVSAGLVGAPVVITIAFSAVAGFLVPSQSDSVSLLRLVLLLVSSFIGFYGIALSLLAILIHISTLDSFGVPFYDGFALTRNQEDTLIRMPLWSMTRRPKGVAQGDVVRRRYFVPPMRPYEEKEDA